jgi:hypothetical protein
VRQKITRIEKDEGASSRYGNPPSWTIHYKCGHSVSKSHTNDLSMKAMFLRKEPDTYLIGVCRVCDE